MAAKLRNLAFLVALGGCAPDLSGTPCSTTADCPTAEMCESGFCVPDESVAPSDDEACEDGVELELDETSPRDGVVCAGGGGALRVHVPEGGPWRVALRLAPHAPAEHEVGGLLCDDEPVEPVFETTHTQIHEIPAGSPGVHQIWLEAGTSKLGWRAALLPRRPCTEDAYEPNGEESRAVRSLEGTQVTAVWLCRGDVDWFELPQTQGDPTRVELSVEGGGRIEASLSGLDADGRRVMGTDPVAVREAAVLAWSAPPGVRPLLRVAGSGDGEGERVHYRWRLQ